MIAYFFCRFVNRDCYEDVVINGIHIRPGMVVLFDLMQIHRDPESWGPEDPELFCPERSVHYFNPSCVSGQGNQSHLSLYVYASIQRSYRKTMHMRYRPKI